MKGLAAMLHPSFDALSTDADVRAGSDSSRTARHVARCKQCADTIADIRRMGEEARQYDPGAPGATLWARIQDSRAHVTRDASAINGSVPRVLTKEPVHERLTGKHILIAIAGLEIAAVILMSLTSPARKLDASGVDRMTFSPGRPVPGSVLKVRYTPSEWFRGQSRLLLLGRYSRGFHDVASTQLYNPNGNVLGDSLATLRPDGSGSYEASFRLSTNFEVLELSVIDTLGTDVDSDGAFLWGIIAGARNGGPSFDALASAISLSQRIWVHRAERHNFAATAADSLAKYFPTHPIGWAYRDNYGVKKGRFDLLSYFESAQRKYAEMDAKLAGSTHLDGERLHDMAQFAWKIDEPVLAEPWVRRLVREHPEHPAALSDLARMLHQIELRAPATARDSVRPWLALLESLHADKGQIYPQWFSEAHTLIERYADSATIQRWDGRVARLQTVASGWTDARLNVDAASLTVDDLAAMRSAASATCSRGAGRYPLFGDVAAWQRGCSERKAQSVAALARVLQAKGDTRAAVALGDSASSLFDHTHCATGFGVHVALLQLYATLGDTEKMKAAASHLSQNTSTFTNNLVRKSLGSAYDSADLARRAASRDAQSAACAAESAGRRSTFAKRLGLPAR